MKLQIRLGFHGNNTTACGLCEEGKELLNGFLLEKGHSKGSDHHYSCLLPQPGQVLPSPGHSEEGRG